MKKIALTFISLVVMTFAMAQQQGNHWTPITGTQYNMTVKGIIVIDGVTQTSNMLEIGAFCGEECRGSRKAAVFPLTGEYTVMLTIVSNVFSGETITFRVYDHASQQELDLISESTLTFEHNTNQGSMNNWFPFNFTTSAQIYTLPITGYGTSEGGYYLIAPPIDDVNPADIEGMTEGDFDLYCFDESQAGEEWRNYRATPFNLESGKGYLYAHKTDVTLSFTGAPYSGEGQVPVAYTAGKPFAGWNLVGNPFGQTACLADGRDFYVMKADGSDIIPAQTNGIQPMQGVFVVAANADDNNVAFTTEMPAIQTKAIVIEISKDRSTFAIDRAIVRFGEGCMLPKFMLNPSSTKVYIPQEGMDYAVVNVGGDFARNVSTDVNFKAAKNGEYTINVNTNGMEFNYLHLIDNLTGADIDLLATPTVIAGEDPQSPTSTYTFIAKTTDYASRFRLVFSVSGDADGDDDAPFAYINNGNIIITADAFDASLQVIDAMGHVLVCRDARRASAISTAGMAPGVYVLRLINGDDVKTQKIVID